MLIFKTVIQNEHRSNTNHSIHNHLFTWCPMALGNLAKAVGFQVRECVNFQHQWIPSYKTDCMKLDFDKRCTEHAKQNGNRQVRRRAMNL